MLRTLCTFCTFYRPSTIDHRPPMPSTISTSKAREFLADLITEVAYKGERVILTRHGKAIAAIISAEDLERLEALEQRAG